MINFLIVEDNDNKYHDVLNTIKEINQEFYIERSISVSCAISKMKKIKYSFVIIDIQLPNTDTENSINSKAGLDLIQWIKHNQKNKKCLPPENILILSEYNELIKKYNQDFINTRVFSYLYNINSNWKKGVSDSIDEYIIKISDKIEKTDEEIIVYSVHGINTNGEWQCQLDNYLSNKKNIKLSHEAYKYQYYPIYSFLIPRQRKKEVDRLIIDLEYCARRAPNSTIHLIGHSFGTYIVCEALKNISMVTSPKFGNIILVNSVLKSNYNFIDIITKHGIKKIISECGINDKILILSQMFAIKLGMAGRIGFKGGLYNTICNRYFIGGHSSILNENRFNDWLKIIENQPIENIDQRKPIGNITSLKNSFLIVSPFVIPSLATLFLLKYIFF